MNDSASTIEQITAAFEAHGYFVSAEAIPGEEAAFAHALLKGLDKVRNTVFFNARHYGYRGLSKRALEALHADLPEPTWGVRVSP